MSEAIQKRIREKCQWLANLLCLKNEGYGDSAFSTEGQVFSKLPVLEGVKIRMDDKLKRIQNEKSGWLNEDAYADLAGYLVIFLINVDLQKEKENPALKTIKEAGENAGRIARRQVEELCEEWQRKKYYAGEDLKKGDEIRTRELGNMFYKVTNSFVGKCQGTGCSCTEYIEMLRAPGLPLRACLCAHSQELHGWTK